MKNKNIILAVFLMTIGLQFSVAQKIDVQNQIEYSQEKDLGIEDLNTINVSEDSFIKKDKKEISQKNISIKDLERIVNKRRTKRYRKIRGDRDINVGKCFKSKNEEEKSCEKE